MRHNKKIAILTRAGFLYHLQIGWGFFETIEQAEHELDWRPILFFCKESNKRVMRAQMEEIQHFGYDLIVSVGAMRTLIAHQFIQENNWDIPLIFCGVTDPVEMGILPKIQAQKNLTGVMREEPSWLFSGEMLLAIKPHMKKLLVPYYQEAEAGLVHKKLLELQKFFEGQNVAVTLLPVNKDRDFPEIVSLTLPTVDTLWCIGGEFFENFHKQLAELCKSYNVTFFAHNTDASDAAISFGDDVRKIGQQLFKQVFDIFENGKSTADIPIITIPNERKIIINADACKAQGLKIDPQLLFCIKNGIIV